MQQKFSHFLTIALLLQRQKKILTTLPISHLRVLFSCYYLIHFQLICNKSTFFSFNVNLGWGSSESGKMVQQTKSPLKMRNWAKTKNLIVK